VSGIDVLRLAPGHAPLLVHTIAVRGTSAGTALSDNGRLLLVAGGAGAAVISVPAAEQGGRHAVLSTLVAPGKPMADAAIEVAISPNGRYAFVSLETAGRIAHWLYATSEVDNASSEPEGATGPLGSLSVVSVARAESDPARSVMARVPAGCTPVRVITSADGRVVWVAARGSDALLAFSAAKLQTEPSHALLADVHVGKAPVGLALARAGTLMVIADSNRFALGLPVSNLAVVDVAAALHGRPALLGYLPAGRFPRDVTASANGSLLLVGNYASGQVEAVNAAELP
jgi:DNA-binding beta-propeller fold protein YncE